MLTSVSITKSRFEPVLLSLWFINLECSVSLARSYGKAARTAGGRALADWVGRETGLYQGRHRGNVRKDRTEDLCVYCGFLCMMLTEIRQ